MAALTKQQKALVVTRLACFHTPTEIKQELKAVHAVEVGLPQISFYDPGTVEGKRLSEELRDLYKSTRERYLNEVQAVPIANRAYRLNRLQKLIDDPSLSRNPMLVQQCLQQAAKEVGNAYTNRQEHSGPGGAPIPIAVRPDLSALDVQELEQLERLLSKSGADPGGGESGAAAP